MSTRKSSRRRKATPSPRPEPAPPTPSARERWSQNCRELIQRAAREKWSQKYLELVQRVNETCQQIDELIESCPNGLHDPDREMVIDWIWRSAYFADRRASVAQVIHAYGQVRKNISRGKRREWWFCRIDRMLAQQSGRVKWPPVFEQLSKEDGFPWDKIETVKRLYWEWKAKRR